MFQIDALRSSTYEKVSKFTEMKVIIKANCVQYCVFSNSLQLLYNFLVGRPGEDEGIGGERGKGSGLPHGAVVEVKQEQRGGGRRRQ